MSEHPQVASCPVEPKTDVQREAFDRAHTRRRNEWKRFWKAGIKAFEAGDYEKAQFLFLTPYARRAALVKPTRALPPVSTTWR